MGKLKSELAELTKKAGVIKMLLQRKIKSLPDNPNIERLGGGAFSMNISEVFKNKQTSLSPEFYDFKSQYNKISNELDKTDSLKVFEKFEKIINEGKVGSTILHPEVEQHLKQILLEV